LLLPVIGAVYYPDVLPPYYVHMDGKWISDAVSPLAWIFGGVAVLICFAACVEAFRRGSRADKVAACIGLLFAISFLTVYLQPLTVPIWPPPNK